MHWKYVAAAIILFLTFSAGAQQPFSGVLEYRATISLPDTGVVLSQWRVRIFTNDTVVRVETETKLGLQTYIRHMELNKAYLLLDYGTDKYAIQNDLSETVSDDTLAPRYSVKRRWFGGKKIAGLKSVRYQIVDTGSKEGYDCWFTKKLRGDYLTVYPEIPFLATDYFLPSPDGLVHYELTEVKQMPLSRDLFGIPSDYKRISFEEFVNLFSGEN